MGGRLSAQRDSEGLPEGEGSNGADAAQKLVLKDPAPVHLGRPLDIDIRHLDARGWPRHGHLATASSERRCTDIVCLFTFLAYLGGLVAIFLVSRRDGDLAKLTHGFDFQGRVCGVDAGVRDLPLLYWCSTAQPDTLLEGICVARCPGEADVSAGTQSWCPGPPRAFEQEQSLATGSTLREVVVGTRRNLTLTPNHASIEALGYCFPAHDVALLQGVLERSPAAAATRQLLLAVHGALESWRFLVAAGCSCICAGYIFLFVLWMCFEPLVYGLLGILHLALLGACAAFVAVGIQPDRGFLAGYISVKATATCAWAGAVLSLGMWLALAVLSCRGREQVRAAVGTVRLTCDVVARMPGLLLQPLLHSLAVVALLLTLVWGLAWVLSTGRVVPYLEAAPTSPASKGAAGSGGSLDFGLGFGLELDGLGDRVAVGGVRRCFELSGAQWSLVVYWLFGILWIVETLSALGQFAVAHAVVGRACLGLDGATKSTSELKVLLRGYVTGVVFHLGTLAFAAFVIGCLKMVAVILAVITRQAGDASADSRERRVAVAAVCCCCCSYWVACMEHLLTMVNDLVYTDVALQSSDYLEAAENVLSAAALDPLAYSSTKALATFVRVLGVATIGGGGAFASYQALAASAAHQQLRQIVFAETSQALALSSILGAAASASVICCYVAHAFMVVFYQTSDALLYCRLVGVVGSARAVPGGGLAMTAF